MASPLPFDLEGGQITLAGWALVNVRGRDGERFLHSQLTADVAGLEVRRSCLSALLDRSGRVRAFCFALRELNSFRLLVPDILLEILLERLQKNLIADDVELVTEETGRMLLALGPAAVELVDSLDPHTVFPLEIYGQSGFVTWSPASINLPELSSETIKSRRLLSGFPSWGLDVNSGQLINETVLVDTAVAHDKGCYLGQETVHKIHSRRGAAFAPMVLEPLSEPIDPKSLVGRTFTVDGGKGGVILDWAYWEDRHYFEASLHRDHRVHGLEPVCLFDTGRSLKVSVRRLPILQTPSLRQTAAKLVEKAAKLFMNDRELQAEQLLARAIAVCPDEPDAYEALGVALGRRGENEQAISLMHQLLEVDPESVMAHANLSVFYKNLGRIADAERELELAQRAHDEPAVISGISPEFAASDHVDPDDEVDRRESMFKQVLAIDPDDVLALFSIGELRRGAHRFREAVEYFERVVDVQPNHAPAHLRLGESLEHLGEPERAAAIYEAGVKAAASAGDHSAADTMQSRLASIRESSGSAFRKKPDAKSGPESQQQPGGNRPPSENSR